MAKEPNGSSGTGKGDEGIDKWEASFFTSDGKEVKRQSQSADRPAGNLSSDMHAGHGAGRTPVQDRGVEKRKNNRSAASVKKHADDLGEALYDKFMGILSKKVAENDGQLTPSDIAEMGKEFRKELKNIETAFLEAVESFTLAREENRVEQSRGQLFERLMVNNFEQQFTGDHMLRDKPDKLSRRMLPGFSSVLLMMFGKENLAAYERMVSDVADKLRKENGGQLEWDDLYQSVEARKICLRAEVEMALHFKNIEKRLQWMIAVINSNLIPAVHGQAGDAWVFNEAAARKLLALLFRDLRTALSKDHARKVLLERLGADQIVVLDNVIGRFC